MDISKFLSKHYDDILTVVTIAGIGATAWGASTATREIDALWPMTYEEFQAEHGEAPANIKTRIANRTEYEVDKARVCWKSYLKVAVPVTITTSSVILMHYNHKKTAAVLSTSLAACQRVYNELESAAHEELGDKKFDAVKAKALGAIASDNTNQQKMINNKPEPAEGVPVQTLIYDVVSDRYSYGDLESIRKAVIAKNDEMVRGDVNWVTYNDLIDEINNYSIVPTQFTPTRLGKCVGWQYKPEDRDDYGESIEANRSLIDPQFEYDEKDGQTYAIMNLNCMPLPPYYDI